MNSIKRFISEWLGYSRRERRASVILVIIITIVILIRYIVPEKGIDIEINTELPPSLKEKHQAIQEGSGEPARYFQFDPNTASFGDLTLLGIPGKVAGTLIRYRNNGGSFNRPEDIMKVYGMDSAMAKTLMPFINIVKPDIVMEEKMHVMISPVEKDPAVTLQININRCDSADLEKLPGIGRVLSARIIKYRELLGGYVSVLQLKEVYGLADSVYQAISEMIIIDSSAVRKINVNKAGFSELDRHPYLGRYDARAIIKYRELKGKIDESGELSVNKILASEKILKIGPYLDFK